MTETIDITTPDGDIVTIEVEEFDALEKTLWAAKIPMDDGTVAGTEKMIQVMIDVTTTQTVLTEDLLRELEQSELLRVLNRATVYAFGKESDERTFDSDFDDDEIMFDDDNDLFSN